MSNPLAIAAVTLTLRNLLFDGIKDHIPGTDVTVKPPDKARNDTGSQINVFLYQTAFNSTFSNMDMPRQVKPGEKGTPPLPLNLYYLVTAYGKNDDDSQSHRLLGHAMGILHDHPVLSSEGIKSALKESDLDQQLERVRITHQPMQMEEMSKLWMIFQTQYRISAAYQVSVVLIESANAAKAPLPVLTRGGPNSSGTADKGVIAQADVIPPFPTIEEIVLPNNQPSARLDDLLTIRGHHLSGGSVDVRFTSTRLADPIIVPAQTGGSATELKVKLRLNAATDPANWPAGFYTVAAIIKKPGQGDVLTNEMAFSLAAVITGPLPIDATRDNKKRVNLSLKFSPQIRPQQRAALLLGDREVLAGPHATQTDQLQFLIEDAPLGEHFIRLRIDGVDSLLVNRAVNPPVFDENQRVKIHV